MTLAFVDVMRNIYSASGGVMHPSAASAAIYGMIWNEAWDGALKAAQDSYDRGGTWEEQRAAFHDSFINRLGWTEAEWHEYWSNPAYDGSGRDAQEFDESWDAFDLFVEKMRRGGR
jgi:hypothetical protein